MLRVLIVDDQEPMRTALRLFLSSRHDWMVCGEARDGLEAVEMAALLKADIVLMDISMPRMDGIAATKILRREIPESCVIVMSQYDTAVGCTQAAEAGASAYLDKAHLSRELFRTVDRLTGDARRENRQADSEVGISALAPAKPREEVRDVIAADASHPQAKVDELLGPDTTPPKIGPQS